MIKFFRNIRQTLLANGQTSKYFKYAFGEIVLVVIGILIALQINTWNQNRMNAKEEQRLLQSISNKMETNRFQYGMGYKSHTLVIAAAERLLLAMNADESYNLYDQIDYDLYFITNRFILGKSNATSIYDELIGAGQLGLLSSNELASDLTLYNHHLDLLASYEDLQNSFVEDQLNPFLNQNIDRISVHLKGSEADSSLYQIRLQNAGISKSNFSNSYAILLKNREFSNLLLELIKHTDVLLRIYGRIDKSINTIDSLVISDLQSKNGVMQKDK